MADKNEKFKQNIEGQFYVDEQCIACDACVNEAPLFFAMNKEDGHAYVYKTTTTTEDIELCMEALRLCPVEAIGSDGLLFTK